MQNEEPKTKLEINVYARCERMIVNVSAQAMMGHVLSGTFRLVICFEASVFFFSMSNMMTRLIRVSCLE